MINAKRLLRFKSDVDLTPQEVKEAREYIKNYWKLVTRYHPKDDASLLGLPHEYLVPAYIEATEFDFNEMYYWDSYFMVQGMLDDQHKDLVIGILDNLIYLYNRFGIIPNASRTYLMGRSQPPFLSSFIFDVYNAYNLGDKWLKEHIKAAESEYIDVWMGTIKPKAHLVYQGLSRY